MKTVNSLDEVRSLCEWEQMGTEVHKYPFFVLSAPVIVRNEAFNMVHHIGKVSGRSDGRWNWFRVPVVGSDTKKFWLVQKHEQGVASTKEKAQEKVEEGWHFG